MNRVFFLDHFPRVVVDHWTRQCLRRAEVGTVTDYEAHLLRAEKSVFSGNCKELRPGDVFVADGLRIDLK